MKQFSHFILLMVMLSLPLVGMANDPKVDNKDNASQNQAESEKIIAVETSTETASQTQQDSGKSTNMQNSEIKESTTSDSNSLSKFNYLFYFIYKHKYQDKEIINQLEEKF